MKFPARDEEGIALVEPLTGGLHPLATVDPLPGAVGEDDLEVDDRPGGVPDAPQDRDRVPDRVERRAEALLALGERRPNLRLAPAELLGGALLLGDVAGSRDEAVVEAAPASPPLPDAEAGAAPESEFAAEEEDEEDTVIVDRWFQSVCRNIALEMYEQTQADPSNRDFRNVVTKDLGNGRSEVS